MLEEWLVDFFEAGFAVVALALEVVLLTVFAGVLLVEREGVLLDRLASLANLESDGRGAERK